jgi:signal transduction histidine kinase
MLELQPAPVYGDPFLLERMIGNLVENAMTYNHPGGRLSIRTRQVGQRSVLEVENTGERVSLEEAAVLFEPFFRVDRSRSRASGGAGLGLAIVERVAHAHHGTATASPRVEGGLCLRVDLPAGVTCGTVERQLAPH